MSSNWMHKLACTMGNKQNQLAQIDRSNENVGLAMYKRKSHELYSLAEQLLVADVAQRNLSHVVHTSHTRMTRLEFRKNINFAIAVN